MGIRRRSLELVRFHQTVLERLELVPVLDGDAEIDITRRPAPPQPERIDQHQSPRRRARHKVSQPEAPAA
jgi:hypothetical protein